MKILVIQQKMIGDVLTSTILFEALRERYPNAQLHYLINTNTLSVVEQNPFIDKCIRINPKDEKYFFKMLRLCIELRQHRYDILIDCYSKLSSNFLSLLSKAKTKISYYKSHSTFIYHHNVIRKKHSEVDAGLEITNRLQLLEPLGIDKKNIKPKIYLTKDEVINAKEYLEKSGVSLKKTLFMISVIGSSSSKTYPAEYMAKIIDTIVEKTNGQILFNYMPSQKNEAKEILDLCNSKTKKSVFFDVFGDSLRKFLGIAKHCTAIIGNEGGAINMAKALNIPTFAIYSPWIDKKGWNMFEDGKNLSVHLIDYKPEFYEQKEIKKVIDDYETFYQAFKPKYIIPKLETFLRQFIDKK